MKYAWLILLFMSNQCIGAEPISSGDARTRDYDEPSVRESVSSNGSVRKYTTKTPDKRQIKDDSVVVSEVPVFIELHVDGDERRTRRQYEAPQHDEDFPRRKLPKTSD